MFHLALAAALILANIIIFSSAPSHLLSVSFLDVGQGDSILIEGPRGAEVLIDGGADQSVLRELGKRRSFFDRSIDAIVATHPDQDHIGGLSDVLERYDVSVVIESGVSGDTAAVRAFDAAVAREGAERVIAAPTTRLLLGRGAYADILYPDRDISSVSDTNSASVVLRVVYGTRAFMLTGDAPKPIEQHLTTIYGSGLASDVLKAGHHGSKTSSLESFVRAVDPEYVIYSRGCDNRYGHPAPEVVALFKTLTISSFDTCEKGTITFRSDGKMLRVSKR